MSSNVIVQPIPPRVQHLSRVANACRHRHDQPYATVVLQGGYEEAGEAGRFQVSTGDVLLHSAFATHLNRFDGRRTILLNLPFPRVFATTSPIGRIQDPEAIARVAERDAIEAFELLASLFVPAPHRPNTDADHLALALRDDCSVRIVEWSARRAVRREVLSRQFRRLYGTTAIAYRLEAKARRAFGLIQTGVAPMAEIALACGFADQAHMTRAIRSLSGAPPTAWRLDVMNRGGKPG